MFAKDDGFRSFSYWQVAIDTWEARTLQYKELSLPMTTLRTARKYEIAHISEYGEATLTMLNRQPEVIAPVRERYRLSVMKA